MLRIIIFVLGDKKISEGRIYRYMVVYMVYSTGVVKKLVKVECVTVYGILDRSDKKNGDRSNILVHTT